MCIKSAAVQMEDAYLCFVRIGFKSYMLAFVDVIAPPDQQKEQESERGADLTTPSWCELIGLTFAVQQSLKKEINAEGGWGQEGSPLEAGSLPLCLCQPGDGGVTTAAPPPAQASRHAQVGTPVAVLQVASWIAGHQRNVRQCL